MNGTEIIVSYPDGILDTPNYFDIDIEGTHRIQINSPITGKWNALNAENSMFCHKKVWYIVHEDERLTIANDASDLGDDTKLSFTLSKNDAQILLNELRYLTECARQKKKYTPVTKGVTFGYLY